MRQSLALTQSIRVSQWIWDRDPDYRRWTREALKAFKKFMHGTQCLCTCNVARLFECDRLGDQKRVTLWRTSFFSQSPHFYDCRGVIFSGRPGTELAQHFRKSVGVDAIYLLRPSSRTEVIDPCNGDIRDFGEEIPFASIAA